MTDGGQGIGAPHTRRLLRWLVLLAGAGHALLAALQQRMNPEGVNYLDMGDAIVRHDWTMAFNSVWSPLYPLILGGITNVLRPEMRWELPVVQGINFAMFLAALFAFEIFWHELTRLRVRRRSDVGESPWAGFPAVAWEWTGYGLFLLCALCMIGVRSVTPDLLAAGLILLASAVLLRIRRDGSTTRRCVTLGALLGLAYLADSAMLPRAFVFVLVLALPWVRHAIGVRGAIAAVGGLLAVAGPWIVLLSGFQGQLTFGDAGRIAYARDATSVPYPHWQGEGNHGTPHHPSRKVYADPAVWEFGFPVGGTYAIGYDPTYWYCGLDAGLELRRQLRVLAHSGFVLFDLLLRQLGAVFLVAALFYLSARRRWRGLILRPEWSLIVPALVAVGMDATTRIEERSIAVFVLLLAGGVLCGMPAPREGSRLASRAVGLMAAALWLTAGVSQLRMVTGPPGTDAPAAASDSPGSAVPGHHEPRPPVDVALWRTASALRDAGIVPGDSIGFIGDSRRAAAWARLARVRITAEILPVDADRFWYTEGDRRAAVLDAFAGQGVAAVLAETGPAGAVRDGFEPLEGTSLLIHRVAAPLPRPEEDPAPGTVFAP